MKKGFNVRTYDISRIEKLKAKYDIKMAVHEKNLHQDNCYSNYVMKPSNIVDPAWVKMFARKGRLVKFITKQREKWLLCQQQFKNLLLMKRL